MKKIVTVGEILVEIMATRRGQGFLEPGPLIGPFPSGAPAIFIDQVGTLGQPCGIIGAVGDDDFGRLNLDRLARDGVDISAIIVHPGAATGSAFVRYEDDGNRHFIFNIRDSAAGRITLDEAAQSMIDGADHVHVMGSSLGTEGARQVVLAAVDGIKAKGGTLSFDPNIRPEMLDAPGLRPALDAVLRQTDLFLPSGPEINLLTGAASEQAAITAALALGVSAVVLKRGANGARYDDSVQTINAPAFAVEEIDPTGAGDCFGATFVTCWLRGMNLERALTLANAAGARAVLRQGPMEGTSTMTEIETWLASHSGPAL